MKTRLFTIFLALLLLASLLFSRPVFAQSCALISSSTSSGLHYLIFGSQSSFSASPWWRAGNYNGYRLYMTDPGNEPLSGNVDISYYNVAGTTNGLLFTITNSHTWYDVTTATGSLAIISASSTPFQGYVCPSGLGTATPVPPTATATNTPVPPTATVTNTPVPPTATNTPVVVVTASPIPPTLTPTVSNEVYLSNIQALTENNFKWGIFVGVVLLGLGAVALVRVH